MDTKILSVIVDIRCLDVIHRNSIFTNYISGSSLLRYSTLQRIGHDEGFNGFYSCI